MTRSSPFECKEPTTILKPRQQRRYREPRIAGEGASASAMRSTAAEFSGSSAFSSRDVNASRVSFETRFSVDDH
jgi:hypothetical protein